MCMLLWIFTYETKHLLSTSQWRSLRSSSYLLNRATTLYTCEHLFIYLFTTLTVHARSVNLNIRWWTKFFQSYHMKSIQQAQIHNCCSRGPVCYRVDHGGRITSKQVGDVSADRSMQALRNWLLRCCSIYWEQLCLGTCDVLLPEFLLVSPMDQVLTWLFR